MRTLLSRFIVDALPAAGPGFTEARRDNHYELGRDKTKLMGFSQMDRLRADAGEGRYEK